MSEFTPGKTIMPEAVPYRDFAKEREERETQERMGAVGHHKISPNYAPGEWKRQLADDEVAEIAAGLLYEKQIDFEEKETSDGLSPEEMKNRDDLAGIGHYIQRASVIRPKDVSIERFLRNEANKLLGNESEADIDDRLAMLEAVKFLQGVRSEADQKDNFIEEHNIRVNRNAQREKEL